MKLNNILNGMGEIVEGINAVRSGTKDFRNDVKGIKKSVESLKDSMGSFKSGVRDVRVGIADKSAEALDLKDSLVNLKNGVCSVVNDVIEVSEGVKEFKADINTVNAAIPTTAVETEVAERMRSSMNQNDTKRDAGLTTPDGIIRFDDIIYGKDPKWQILDVYRPKELPTGIKKPRKKSGSEEVDLVRLPVIISVHGGAWVYGSKEVYQHYCMSLAQRGFAVINYTYRLAPEFKFPAPLEDLNLVVKWMKRNAKEYGFDVKNVSFVGDSAGGNIAGLYACMCTNEDYALKYKFKVPKNFKPIAMGLNCGAYDPANFISERELMTGLVLKDKNALNTGILNVTDNITSDFPPTYLMSATGDFCLKYFEPMMNCLKAKGVDVKGKIFGDQENKLGHVFHLDVRSDIANSLNDAECAFFMGYYGKKA